MLFKTHVKKMLLRKYKILRGRKGTTELLVFLLPRLSEGYFHHESIISNILFLVLLFYLKLLTIKVSNKETKINAKYFIKVYIKN